jgi:hypothetical protein
MAMRKKDETVVFPNAAAIDVGATSHWWRCRARA